MMTALQKQAPTQIERLMRHKPTDFITVVDPLTSDVVGKVRNINEGGLGLIVDSGYTAKESHPLNLLLSSGKNTQIIELMAVPKWVEPNQQKSHVLAGFSIETMNLKSKFRLKQFLKSF